MDYGALVKWREGSDMLSEIMKNDLIKGLCSIFSEDIPMIILYGSVARNEATTESDIDIAIVLTKNMDAETRVLFIRWAADMDLRYDRIFSVIDIENEKFKKWGKILPFYKNIQTEGIVLWKAA